MPFKGHRRVHKKDTTDYRADDLLGVGKTATHWQIGCSKTVRQLKLPRCCLSSKEDESAPNRGTYPLFSLVGSENTHNTMLQYLLLGASFS